MRSPNKGLISYRAITINQQVRTAKEKKDYMTHWEEWLDVQNGADLRDFETYEKKNPRIALCTRLEIWQQSTK